MKITIAVAVHDRIKNIERWINCFKQCSFGKIDVELVIIHNYSSQQQLSQFLDLVMFEVGYNEDNLGGYIHFVPRKNGGYDIGAMQDVFTERIFLNFDYILWCTDDVIPMQKDFIIPFLEAMRPGVGVTAMQISGEHLPHVRTTGFMISKEVSKKIIFPADPIKTIQQCHLFEHSEDKTNFTNQIRELGLDCVQVAPLMNSPLYDMGWPVRNKKVLKDKAKYDRMKEHEQIFNYAEIA